MASAGTSRDSGSSRTPPVKAVPGTLHDFFRTVDKVHDRRPLNAPTPLPRKKPLTAGRTNPPAVGAATGAVNAGFLRRVRPRAKAVVFPPPMPEIVSAPGARLKRDQPLTVEDLWQSPEGGPPHLDNISKEESCGICLQLLSHPVFYPCGHGHCYTCARIWLEERWDCNECDSIITRPPIRIPVLESFIRRTHGEWDTSKVTYDWSGLVFPVVPNH